MKKVLMVLGVIFLVLIVLFAGMLIWAQRSGAKIQEEFYTAILSGDPAKVTAMCAPDLLDRIDEPALAAWMAEIKDKLGAFKGLRKTNFSTSTKIENGARITTSKGVVDFERGAAESELVYRDGKLIIFEVTCAQLKTDPFASPQKRFFKAILSGNPGKVTAMCHPALRDEIDEPVLAAWMAEVKDKLGAFKGLRKTNFSTSTKIENGVKVTESKGMVDFEKGSAESELKYYDGKLIKFNIKSDQLKTDAFPGPTSTDLYRERGKEFLTLFLANKPDETFAMMHSALQKKVPLEKLKTMMAGVTGKAGPTKAITWQSEKLEPGEPLTLKLLYNVECEKAKTVASVEFQFIGFKGHLLAFNLTGE